MTPDPLPASALRRTCDPALLVFDDTSELEPLDRTLGQERALEALEFGVRMPHQGYDLFVLGPTGSGRHETVRRVLRREAAGRPVPDDWCYVNDFSDPRRPRALRLPPGRGVQLRQHVRQLVDDLGAAIPGAFRTDDYRARRDAVVGEFKEKHEEAFEALRQRAEERDIVLARTPNGLALAPVRDGKVLTPEQFEELTEKERVRIDAALDQLGKELEELLRRAPRWAQEQRERLRELDREITSFAVDHLIAALLERYADLPEVVSHLEAVRDDVVEHANEFMQQEGNPLQAMLGMAAGAASDGGDFRRYQVNVLVDHGRATGAPVVDEDQPTQHRIVGRIEHQSQLGALVTDFSLIEPGCLHAANGGYLILDARKLLAEPYAWDALKRALRSRTIQIGSLAERLNLVSTVSLEPEPIPLDVKVVLVGERQLYYLLARLDPEFAELFKVQVDFEDALRWEAETVQLFARSLGTFARGQDLRPLERGAVARLVEHAARLAEDQQKLSSAVEHVRDLVREADHFAARDGRERVGRSDVQRAVDARIRRSDRVRRRLQEDIQRGVRRIGTSGTAVGQVNGLSVLELGGFAFGMPARISARVRLGKGEVVDIEREAELGGPLHSKGVLILAGFLGARFGGGMPLCLSASLVFEQSYGRVDGDSASSAELYALLSALSGLPIRQRFAVTGSVDQHGNVQAIGGVNEKVEGFFDVCAAGDGLSGEQGVLVPAANVEHLMLREDVVEAVAQGRFHVYAVATVDEGIGILTGVPSGCDEDADGSYPEGSVNRRVQDALSGMAERVRAFGRAAGAGEGS